MAAITETLKAATGVAEQASKQGVTFLNWGKVALQKALGGGEAIQGFKFFNKAPETVLGKTAKIAAGALTAPITVPANLLMAGAAAPVWAARTAWKAHPLITGLAGAGVAGTVGYNMAKSPDSLPSIQEQPDMQAQQFPQQQMQADATNQMMAQQEITPEQMQALYAQQQMESPQSYALNNVQYQGMMSQPQQTMALG